MAPTIQSGSQLHEHMRTWRRDLHAHPETAYEEFRTAERVARVLSDAGVEVVRGIGGTGVVGTVHGKHGPGAAIALRADMDALPIQELNVFAHRSTADGRMHACGHDGHTAMLLGAACALAANPDFRGAVHFIFQPAEEDRAGAEAMIKDGLFERFPVKSVFGLHNWPELPAGQAAVHEGPVMAAYDTFEIVITGRGSHGACPHQGADPIYAAGQLVTALQSIVSRNVDPQQCSVISVTQIQGGSTYNALPEKVLLRGTARSFSPDVRDQIETRMHEVAEGLCGSLGCSADVRYFRRYPATINSAADARDCLAALQSLPGMTVVHQNPPSSMCGEDFAFMLQERPGCYIWLGSAGPDHQQGLHSAYYDFNDGVLLLGANYWISLVNHLLNPNAPQGGREVHG